MPVELPFPVGVVHLRVGPGAVLAEPLFFPELARLAADAEAATAAVHRALAARIPTLDPAELLRRRRAGAARLHRFALPLDPPRASAAWRTPVRLPLAAVVWEHPGGFVLARVPALGVEVVATAADELDEVLRLESLAAIRLADRSKGLRPLAGVLTAARLDWATLPVTLPTLKERHARRTDDEPKRLVLPAVASRVRDTPPAFEVDAAVSAIADALTSKPPQSVLLVGPSGVGKTAAFYEVVRRADQLRLGATPFWRTGGARLVAGQTGFGMWEERCQAVIREAARTRAVVHLGALVELMDVGKSEGNPTGVATFLRPAIARGELLAVAECTPEQLPLVEKEDPQLLDAFRHVVLEEPTPAVGRAILEQFARADRRREPTADALAAIDRLHRRYATYSASPGRPLRFLDRLRRDGAPGTRIEVGEVYAGFGRETGLPPALLDPAVPLDVGATRDWFAARVVGQPEAVDLVTDLLATVKAGLARPNRPVASLLFAGPTGVGKTELAKALAEFLFGSADRLTRFDMSEYSDPVAVRRLVGGAAGGEGLLTAAVREQPFCVLLLDELEKADRSAFDLLLQALGEARLTDAGGRLADFRNAVVVLTSNLGADTFRTGRAGFAGGPPADAGAHFGAAVEKFLRPELVNRLDRIVPFAPLGTAVIRRIAGREWDKVRHRDGLRLRGVDVATADGLLDHLARAGFDPVYGARPLKRAVDREVLAPLARQLNRHPGDLPLTAEVGVADGRVSVGVRPVPGAKPRGGEPTGPAGRLAVAAQDLRRWHQLLEQSSAVRELANELFQLAVAEKRVAARQRAGKPLRPDDGEALARLGRLRQVQAELDRHRDGTSDLEDEAVVGFHAGGDEPAAGLADRLAALQAGWDALLLRLYEANRPAADVVTLALFAEHRGHLVGMSDGYRAVATKHGVAAKAVAFVPLSAAEVERERAAGGPVWGKGAEPDATAWHGDVLFERARGPVLRRTPVTDALPAGAVGLAVGLRGPAAEIRFAAEGGLHKFPNTPADQGPPDVLVTAAPIDWQRYRPPVAAVRRGFVAADNPRRVYDLVRGTVDDRELGDPLAGLWGGLGAVLESVLAAGVRHRLRQVVLE